MSSNQACTVCNQRPAVAKVLKLSRCERCVVELFADVDRLLTEVAAERDKLRAKLEAVRATAVDWSNAQALAGFGQELLAILDGDADGGG